jgi:ABC-2 type transport system ATP-binding protein
MLAGLPTAHTTMSAILSIEGLAKTYGNGFEALKPVNLSIERGEIFALLGPNGAGKSTLINIVCGLVTASAGRVRVDGHDIVADYRRARTRIGLVPQEIATDLFETPWDTCCFSRRLFGRPYDAALIERVLRDLSLWDKRKERIRTLSGGMKRRVMIAKALAHEPLLLFLDEPTAGVDVELRRDMWALVRRLRDDGVTVILTTHYLEEAEEMADRIGVIQRGELMLVEEKRALMQRLGKRRLHVHLESPLEALPAELDDGRLKLEQGGSVLAFDFDASEASAGVRGVLRRLDALGIGWRDLDTRESSLEDIFVELIREQREVA